MPKTKEPQPQPMTLADLADELEYLAERARWDFEMPVSEICTGQHYAYADSARRLREFIETNRG